MVEGTGPRLDTVDIADGSGWQINSTYEADVFTKGAVTIKVRCSANDGIESAVKSSATSDLEEIEPVTTDAVERLRSWLTGRPDVGAPPIQPAGGYRADSAAAPDGWTREEFIAAVEDPAGRAFLLRILELIDFNSQFPAEGKHARLYFGKRPGGAAFFFPYGRRFPPFKFARQGRRTLDLRLLEGQFRGHRPCWIR